MRKKIVEVCAVFLVAVIIYVVVDIVFGIIKPLKPYESNPERLTTKAYLNEPYFSEEFLIESFLQPGGWTSPEGTKLIFPQEFHGKFFNVDILPPVDATYRRTINDIPAEMLERKNQKDLKKILILGGSTVYCSEVPDSLTIASILAKRLKTDRTQERYFILNAGVTSANSTQELERLKYELDRGLRPDIVLIYDGINDVTQGVYFGDPDGVMFSHKKRNKINEMLKKILPLNVYYHFRRKSESESLRKLPAHMTDIKSIAALADRTKEKYKNNILNMKKIAALYNFKLIIMLQPNVYSLDSSNNRDSITEIKRLAELRTPKIDLAFSIGYPLLRKAIPEIEANGVEAYDISQIFNSVDADIFLDIFHINSGGNKIIAESMEKIILGQDLNK
jgi:lysophospholipase L1-like esterase